NPDEIASRLAENDKVIADKRTLLDSIRDDLASVEREMDQVYRLYIDGTITSAGLGQRYRPREEREAALPSETPRLQGEIDALAMDLLSAETVIAEAQTLYQAWDTLTFEEKRVVLETVVERITIGERTVNIDLAYVSPVSERRPFDGDRPPASPSPQAVVKRIRNYAPV